VLLEAEKRRCRPLRRRRILPSRRTDVRGCGDQRPTLRRRTRFASPCLAESARPGPTRRCRARDVWRARRTSLELTRRRARVPNRLLKRRGNENDGADPVTCRGVASTSVAALRPRGKGAAGQLRTLMFAPAWSSYYFLRCTKQLRVSDSVAEKTVARRQHMAGHPPWELLLTDHTPTPTEI